MNDIYRQKAMGKIPKGWEIKKLGKYIDIYSGYAFKRKDFISNNPNAIPVIKIGNLKNGFVVIDRKTNYVNNYYYKKLREYQMKPEDVLIALSGATTGKIAIVSNEIKFALLNQRVGLFKIIDLNRIYKKFFYFLFQTDTFNKSIKRNIGQSAQGNLSPEQIKKVKIILPPISEQKKITEILSIVDEGIQKVDEVIRRTERLKKGLMQNLLTKGIGHKDFKDTKIGRIPKDWGVKELRETVEKDDDIVAGPFGSNLKVSDYIEEGIPIIRLQNIERNKFVNKDIKYISLKKANELKYHSFKSGDIVLAKLGDPIGKTCIIPTNIKCGIVVADVVRIRASNKKAYRDFIEYILNSNICIKQLHKQIIGSTRPRVNITQIRNLKIPIVPIKEQQKIAEILSTIDKKIELQRKRKEKLERIKKSLMNDLLSGKKRVRIG